MTYERRSSSTRRAPLAASLGALVLAVGLAACADRPDIDTSSSEPSTVAASASVSTTAGSVAAPATEASAAAPAPAPAAAPAGAATDAAPSDAPAGPAVRDLAGIDANALDRAFLAHALLRPESGPFASTAPRAAFATAASVSGTSTALRLPPKGTPVKVTGQLRGGQSVTVDAERLADGTIAFIDSSQPGADRRTGKGLSIVFDGASLASLNALPGPVATMKAGGTPDPDVLNAAWSAKATLDYFRTEHGRASFDGKGAPILSVVHVPAALGDCDSFSYSSMFLFTGACEANGQQMFASTVDPSFTADMFVYNMALSMAPRYWFGGPQSSSVVFGWRDYFALLVQNRVLQEPLSVTGVLLCDGAPDSWLCRNWKPDQRGQRDLDNGAVLDDAQFLLSEPGGNLDTFNRFGATVENSLVLSNALYQIRLAFAGEDGGDPLTSKAAARFDKIVFRSMVESIDDNGDLANAAATVYQSAKDLGASSDELAVIQQQFVNSQLCAGCAVPDGTPTAVAEGPLTEHRPAVVDGGVMFTRSLPGDATRQNGTDAVFVGPASAGGEPTTWTLAAQGDSSHELRGRGDWVVDTRYSTESGAWKGIFLSRLSTGTEERLDDYRAWASPAVSRTTTVWAGTGDAGPVVRARTNTGGPVSELKVPTKPILLGIDGSNVAYQLLDGTLGVWDLATNTSKVIDTLPSMSDEKLTSLARVPGAVEVAGGRVAVLHPVDSYAAGYEVKVYDVKSGTSKVLSKKAFPAGLAFSGSTVVWSEDVGDQPSAIAKLFGHSAIDTDLVGYSIKTGKSAVLLSARGQQGFPSLDGNRLAWQDSLADGDDIYEAVLPAGW